MDDETESESEPGAKRRTVLRGVAAAALVSIGGSVAVGARDGRGDPERERVAETLREFGDSLEDGSQPFRDAYDSFAGRGEADDADGDEDESEGDAIDTFVDGEFCPK